jgi:hypothetical protein
MGSMGMGGVVGPHAMGLFELGDSGWRIVRGYIDRLVMYRVLEP